MHKFTKAPKFSLATLLVICLVLSLTVASLTWFVKPDPSYMFPATATYIVEADGVGNYRAIRFDGHILCESTNASYVFNSAINSAAGAYNVSSRGGKIFVRQGSYMLASKILITQRHIILEGETGNTTITGDILPLLEISGHGMALGPDVTLNDIQLSNFRFYYTGPVQAGSCVYIHEIQNDNGYGAYQGAVHVRNINILSSQNITNDNKATTVPTDLNFIGLRLDSIIGIHFDYVNVYGFGVGIRQGNVHTQGYTWLGSSNIYENVNVAYCHYGVYYSSIVTAGNPDSETWIALKCVGNTGHAFCTDAFCPESIILISPNFESNIGWATMALDGWHIEIDGGFFYWNVGPNIQLGSHGYAEVRNTFFDGVQHNHVAIQSARPVFLYGNRYGSGIATKVKLDAGGVVYGNDPEFLTENSGNATIVASTSVTFPHGLGAIPTGVWASFNDTMITGWTWTATSTDITITVAPLGTYTIYWTAICKP